MPRFSIVIPCFNAEATILETLASIRAQSFSDFEMICVDDGSTDDTRAMILSMQEKDRRIILARNTGKGPSAARNLGALELAKGDIVAFCDADDLWAPSKLASLDASFRFTTTDAAYSQIAFFQHTPEDATTISTVPREDLAISHLLGENPVCTMSNIAVRRGIFAETKGFDPKVVHNEDLEWLIRLVGTGARVVSIGEVLTYYRRNPNGLSANLTAMARGRAAALETALEFGFRPSSKDEAIYLRYLARRALRIGQNRLDAAVFAFRGMLRNPAGFLSSPRRGALTLFGAFAALVLPRSISQMLFSR